MLEDEHLAWQQSYLFDVVGFLVAAHQQEDPDVLRESVATAHAHVAACLEQVNLRRGELVLRVERAGNPAFLEQVDWQRRGKAVGYCLPAQQQQLLDALEAAERQQAIKASAAATAKARQPQGSASRGGHAGRDGSAPTGGRGGRGGGRGGLGRGGAGGRGRGGAGGPGAVADA